MNKLTSYLFSISFLLFFNACQKKADLINQDLNNEAMDTTTIATEQADTVAAFSRTLTLQNISFNVTANRDLLTVQPTGYELDNNVVTKEIKGMSVTNAEIEDLNSDGFPEILIYLKSDGSGSYGTVLGFSSNKNKSMSEISFPSVADNPKANKGYMGHDEFSIVETSLAHRFPIYLDGNTNSNPSGKMRQIQYKLKDGEASRIFVVDKIIEF